jgi:large subunit ribosomal protein L21
MYAVIRTGGKQYRVQPGDLLVVEKLDGEPGANVAFADVLMLGEGEAVTVGAPLVTGASVSATLIETRKGEKVKIFKKIRRQGYRRTRGHRQFQSVLRVTAIAGAGQEAKWDGEVKLTTKAELDARARGLDYVAPLAAGLAPVPVAAAEPAKKAAPKKAAPKPESAEAVAASDEVKAAMDSAETNAPVAEAPKKPAPKKAAAPKAEAGTETKTAAPKKPAAKKKDEGAAE